MPQFFYPAILYPADDDGLHGVVVPGINVNGSGPNQQAALSDATAILQEVIDDFASSDEVIPLPAGLETIDAEGGQIVLLPASVPGKSQRINVMMPEELIARIDAAAPNRSAFISAAARAFLASQRDRVST